MDEWRDLKSGVGAHQSKTRTDAGYLVLWQGGEEPVELRRLTTKSKPSVVSVSFSVLLAHLCACGATVKHHGEGAEFLGVAAQKSREDGRGST